MSFVNKHQITYTVKIIIIPKRFGQYMIGLFRFRSSRYMYKIIMHQ